MKRHIEELALRALWTSLGVPIKRQDDLIRQERDARKAERCRSGKPAFATLLTLLFVAMFVLVLVGRHQPRSHPRCSRGGIESLTTDCDRSLR